MNTDNDFESLLSECVARFEREGPSALEECCARHPASETRLRQAVARLHASGLLAREPDAPLPATLGDYEILARLGRGGMGVVYLVREPRTRERVAIKLGPAPLEAGDRTTARFEREMQALKGLVHPHLVRVRDVGTIDGRPYYTMDFIAGATVEEILATLRAGAGGLAARDVSEARRVVRAGIARFTPDQSQPDADGFTTAGRTWIEFACRVVLDAARALAYVHAQGIVHRDVKPSNIIIDGTGRASVFDLGLAHVEDGPRITRSNEFAGTPHYVAPEVARGSARSATPRSDVFALGVTLFELLTLTPPFDGPNATQVLAAISEHEAPSPRRIDAELSRDLETICATALARDPERRYSSMDDFAADLERFLAFRPVRARPAGSLTRALRFARRRPAAAAAIGLLAVIAIGLPTGLAVANRSIRYERDRAEHAADEATDQARISGRVSAFLVDLFRTSGARADSMTAAEIVERGSRTAEGDFSDEPLVRAALLEALGRVQANAGAEDKGLQLLDRSLAIRQRELGETHADTARTLHAIGAIHLRRGDLGHARRLFERALAALTGAPFATPADEALLRSDLGDACLRAGDIELALHHLTRALEIERADAATSKSSLTRVLELLGRAQLAAGALNEAATSLTAAREALRRALIPDLEARRRVLLALADVARAQGHYAAAEALQVEAGAAPPAAPSAASEIEWTVADSAELLALFAPPWKSQYDRAFQRGITTLQARDHSAAEQAFRECLTLRPRDAVCAYNMACVNTLAGSIESGLEWLKRAAEFGGGRSPTLLAVAERDNETALLRADPRGVLVLEQMRRDAEAPVAPARLVLPEGAPPVDGRPLVVLLCDEPTGTASVDSFDWEAAARAHDCALLIPSPRHVSGATPSVRAVWVDSVADFSNRPWAYEEPVVAEIFSAIERRGIDSTRVFLVATDSGAQVAFDLACRAPGIVRGVLIADGPIHPSLSLAGARAASAAGSIVRLVHTDDSGVNAERRIELTRRYLAHCGFSALEVADGATGRQRMEAALTQLLAAPPVRR
ncbi:MAG: serine/threonine protein kinase [Planctomycetes bacterium]|nr:serine/threonine protein kinase [Planctomycetota bacterium]